MQNIVLPRRAEQSGAAFSSVGSPAPDDVSNVFALLHDGIERRIAGALITIVEVEGGSARGLGAQMAVLADGRYCGYVSGGCIEPAIASEAMRCIEGKRDAVLRFGVGSPFLDIRLPCGGSIEVHIHVNLDKLMIAQAIEHRARRDAFAIEFVPTSGHSALRFPIDKEQRSGWHNDTFRRCYAPQTRLLLIGRGLELEQTVRIAASAGLDVVAFCADDDSAAAATAVGAATTRLTTPRLVPALPIDAWTAVVFLFHDHDWEAALLPAALKAEPYFIGAMGSRRTHQFRRERLLAAGVPQRDVDKVKGPIGLFGPTRDAASLALSILAELTERRLQLEAA
jgi:xanthine dehydrogenase accessory factor